MNWLMVMNGIFTIPKPQTYPLENDNSNGIETSEKTTITRINP